MISTKKMMHNEKYWRRTLLPSELTHSGAGYDASDWQNSLIEREKVELTGNALCKAMLDRGDKIVVCIVKDSECEDDDYYDAITHYGPTDGFHSTLSYWHHVIPINNQGEPLTAKDVRL